MDNKVDYTWIDVKKATNRCINSIISMPQQDPVKDIYNNGLPEAMGRVAIALFIDEQAPFKYHDVILIKKAMRQLNKTGSIGNQEDK